MRGSAGAAAFAKTGRRVAQDSRNRARSRDLAVSLIRQFEALFGVTPHQMRIRARLVRGSGHDLRCVAGPARSPVHSHHLCVSVPLLRHSWLEFFLHEQLTRNFWGWRVADCNQVKPLVLDTLTFGVTLTSVSLASFPPWRSPHQQRNARRHDLFGSMGDHRYFFAFEPYLVRAWTAHCGCWTGHPVRAMKSTSQMRVSCSLRSLSTT